MHSRDSHPHSLPTRVVYVVCASVFACRCYALRQKRAKFAPVRIVELPNHSQKSQVIANSWVRSDAMESDATAGVVPSPLTLQELGVDMSSGRAGLLQQSSPEPSEHFCRRAASDQASLKGGLDLVEQLRAHRHTDGIP